MEKSFNAIIVVFFIALLIGLVAFPFMWGWNYAVVNAITIAKEIDYGTAFVLMLFIGFFIKSSSSSSKK